MYKVLKAGRKILLSTRTEELAQVRVVFHHVVLLWKRLLNGSELSCSSCINCCCAPFLSEYFTATNRTDALQYRLVFRSGIFTRFEAGTLLYRLSIETFSVRRVSENRLIIGACIPEIILERLYSYRIFLLLACSMQLFFRWGMSYFPTCCGKAIDFKLTGLFVVVSASSIGTPLL